LCGISSMLQHDAIFMLISGTLYICMLLIYRCDISPGYRGESHVLTMGAADTNDGHQRTKESTKIKSMTLAQSIV
jgi:hypothetical protein